MMIVPSAGNAQLHPSGIAGLDAMLYGGFRDGRTMLVTGGPGSGKTMLGAQFIAAGAASHAEPGILLSFEESPERLIADYLSVDFPFVEMVGKTIHLVDGRPPSDVVAIGDFDLQGLLASLEFLVREYGIKRIVIDAIDALFALSRDPDRIRRETIRLLDWLDQSGLTALMTLKTNVVRERVFGDFDFAEFAVDGVLQLRSVMHGSLLQRTARIVKRRGSSFVAGEHPYTISGRGLRVMCSPLRTVFADAASTERYPSGIWQLDEMLAGGYMRGTTTLISGLPGVAKTTFGAAFLAAGCAAGERCLFIGFDEPAAQMVRNVRSVGIDLDAYVRSGLLRLESFAAGAAIADDFLVLIEDLIDEHRPALIVVDPISALLKAGGVEISESAIERLVVLFKARGLTAVFTTLSDPGTPVLESTPTRVSTVADTWIHLSFEAQGGERNRTLTIVKSRGTAHSVQTREVFLDGSGITLADIYNDGGETLYGSARLERQQQLRAERAEEELSKQHALQLIDEQGTALDVQAEQIVAQRAQLAERRAAVARNAATLSREADVDATARRVQREVKPEHPAGPPAGTQ